MRHLGITMISLGVLVFVSFTKTLAISRVSKADVEALMAFKNDNDPDNYLADWIVSNTTTSACKWSGLKCSLIQHLWRVSEINLPDFFGLEGYISPYLGNLSHLVSLDLSRNRLSGSIPESFSKLFRLRNLNLAGNFLTGTLPTFLSHGNSSDLVSLDLSGNNFNGSILESFSKLLRLRNLNLAGNLLTGRLVLPVSNLESIDVSHNSLSGSLPISVSYMYNLTFIDFSHNNFSGSIPEWIFELQNLTKMRLSYNAFSGPIPNAISISNLSSLEDVDFSHNKLTGPLPDWLRLLHGVTLLDFSYNDFHGRAPCSLYGRSYFTGNAKVCGSCLGMPLCKAREHTTTEHNHKHRHHELLLLFLLILVGIFGIICFVLVIYVSLTRASRKIKSIYGDIGFGNQRLKILSQEDLKAATGGFSMRNFLGEGSYATVYRGVLQDGEIVAVKLFQDFHKKRARKSFLAECHTLGKVRHKNLVRIMTACSSEDFNALVLEFMPNGSLDRLLHSRAQYLRFSAIDLKTRLRFLTEIAAALSYLHHDCTPTIIHCDVKPQNVLLDGDVCARLSDFGIARLVNDSSGGVTTTLMLKGSIGYIAPEYGVGASVCTRGDVYSFGVTVLEVMTRIKPTDAIIGSSEMGFPKWVSMAMRSKEEMVATLLSREGQEAIHKDNEEVEKFARLVNLGLICTSSAPEKRPTMRQVHTILREFSHEPKEWSNYSLDEILELHLLHRQTIGVSDSSSSTFD